MERRNEKKNIWQQTDMHICVKYIQTHHNPCAEQLFKINSWENVKQELRRVHHSIQNRCSAHSPIHLHGSWCPAGTSWITKQNRNTNTSASMHRWKEMLRFDRFDYRINFPVMHSLPHTSCGRQRCSKEYEVKSCHLVATRNVFMEGPDCSSVHIQWPESNIRFAGIFICFCLHFRERGAHTHTNSCDTHPQRR